MAPSRGSGRTSRAAPAALVAAAFAAFVVAAPASAGTLDQQQTGSDPGFVVGLYGDQSAAQTFTAGISGELDQVDLLLGRLGTPPAPVTVELRSTSADGPGTAVLASASVPVSAIEDPQAFVSVRFATPPPVVAGTKYAIVAPSAAPMSLNSATWGYKTGDPYPPGALFYTNAPGGNWIEQPDQDFAFRTYVAPSARATCKGEPATISGTEGRDRLVGTGDRDVIVGLGGADKISGSVGKDLICGDGGRDRLRGGSGKDRLLGQAGRDELIGGKGNDRCKGGAGRDEVKSC